MTYLWLFLEFFKIGLFTIGGGYAMIPLIKETVLNHEWMSEARFYDLIGVCESTPGPVAINMATFVGSTQGGILGSFIATIGVVLPSFIIILIIVTVFSRFLDNKYVQYGISGINGVVIGLILATGITLLYGLVGVGSYNSFTFDPVSSIIFILLLFIWVMVEKVAKKKFNAISIILTGAMLGIIVCIFRDSLIIS